MKPQFRFQPLSFSWVALHPNPKGVVQFIGGAFFGSFPTLFYRYFLRNLFEEGYTIVALPFRFSFRHWPIAISLLREQTVLRREIAAIAQNLGYQHEIYQDKTNYFWVGHSLGCKYLALLEVLDDLKVVEECVADSRSQYQRIADSIQDIPLDERSIKGQPSLLIAPDISDTESAIPQPLAFLAHFLDKVGLGVLPTRKQTQCFVERSRLFNLTALISFDKDTIAGSEDDIKKSPKEREKSDVVWAIAQLKARKFPILQEELPGKHLEPVGIQIGDYVVDLNPLDKFIEPIKYRFLETVAIQFLEEVKRREKVL
ncbi:DUF1350 family protein [Microcoleus sp. FACHB-831]|uniref:DUF1350 family protein n=1 Tax=Microcoleus sp. FACHB-831 TaxID=2692827 RepID=UPI0016883C86|nr:DUF1350 family protein [Microcoleus sp. FACHB-831]MBD1922840.1 DUF1350 family protein [Microcoleus sp. FACHB-831]